MEHWEMDPSKRRALISGWGTALIGLVNLLMSYIFVTCLNHAAECQVFRIRGLFLQSILRQNIGWYDTHETNDFASRMTEYGNRSLPHLARLAQ